MPEGEEKEAPTFYNEVERVHLLMGKSQNFASKLHYTLLAAETNGMEGVVSWMPHGRCFVVHKHSAFAENILPL